MCRLRCVHLSPRFKSIHYLDKSASLKSNHQTRSDIDNQTHE